jgi:SAM-dependent MidA family methyltransferase
VIVIDYGDEAKHLYRAESFPHGTLAANRGHATHTDFYRDLGSQDLTAHVNFTPLLETLEAAGYKRLFFGTQSRFLLDNGLPERLQEKLSKTTDEFERLRLAQRAKQLYHPEAMGDAFRVLHARSG